MPRWGVIFVDGSDVSHGSLGEPTRCVTQRDEEHGQVVDKLVTADGELAVDDPGHGGGQAAEGELCGEPHRVCVGAGSSPHGWGVAGRQLGEVQNCL